MTYTPKEVDKYLRFTVYYFDRTCRSVYSDGQRCLKTVEAKFDSATEDEDGLIILQQVTNTPATGNVEISFYTCFLVWAANSSYRCPTTGETHTNAFGWEINAGARNVRDENGLQSLKGHQTVYNWQWFRIDPLTQIEEDVTPGRFRWIYIIKNADRGKIIQARVWFLDDLGNTETLRGSLVRVAAGANDAATGSPVITGRAQVGEPLSADPSGISDANGIADSTFIYQWFANDGAEDTAIEDATSSTYTPVADDAGKTIKVQVIFMDNVGNIETLTSAPTATVEPATAHSVTLDPANSPATGVPGISGTAALDEVLTATTDAIEDEDGLDNASFVYQWVRHDLATSTDADIAGATGSTYTVTADDEGKAIKVRVTFTDDAGNQESLTSYAVIAALPLAAAPSITTQSAFTVVEGETAAGTMTAEDEDTPAADLVWSISGGADRGHFQLNATGELTFLTAKDFESPDDFDGDGTYEVTVQVSDGDRIASADITVTLSNLNEAPTADAGEDQEDVQEDTTVTLSGAASDPDADDILAYTWTQTAGTTVTLSTPAEATTDFTAPTDLTADETLDFTLRVTDGAGLYDEDTVTVTVTAPPLTATIRDAPDSHDGQSAFAFELHFSEDIPLSYVTLRDDAFTVSGGDVTQARRLNPPSNIGWELTVTPGGDGNITVALPETTDCDAQGAVCAEDGRMLSERVELTVTGPPSQQQSSDDNQNDQNDQDDQNDGTTQTPASPPSAPTGLTATVNGNGSITLTWNAPGDDTITGYRILRRRPAEGERTLRVYVENTGTTATTYTDTGVTAGTQHVYRVKAVNSAGAGPQSSYVNVDP